MIPFNKPPYTENEDEHVIAAMHSSKLCGDGPFTHRVHKWFESHIEGAKVFLTPSCTHALEMAAMLINVQPGDEIIMPSYTFVSTANAFVLRGAKIVFVDIRPDTMNIDEKLIEAAVTKKTKAIVPVHYAGVACEMDTIMSIAQRHNLFVIEDAAQGMMSRYKNRPLGSIGNLAAFSFHETKNYTSGGEGGLLIVNDKNLVSRAEIIREKGTNRSHFFRGMVDKYTWVDVGSSYLPGELQAAYLLGQLEVAEKINGNRLATWNYYFSEFKILADRGVLDLPSIPSGCLHNAHMFYVKVKDLFERTKFIEYLKAKNISAVFHYVPLHSTPAGIQHSIFSGEDIYTTKESERLLRLPIWYGLAQSDKEYIVACVNEYFNDV